MFKWQLEHAHAQLYTLPITISLFQLLRTKAHNDTKSVLSYLLTDNDTTIDTQSRHAANVVSIVAEMLRCKYGDEFERFHVHSDRVECNFMFLFGAAFPIPITIDGQQMIRMAMHYKERMKMKSIYRLVFFF